MLYVIGIIKDYLSPIIEEYSLLYFILLFLTSIVGGVDEKLATLIIVSLITIVTKILYRKEVNLKYYVKVYLVICLGYILDLIFGFSTSLRDYMIIYYTYNTLTEVFNLFLNDRKFKLPSQLKDLTKKYKKE